MTVQALVDTLCMQQALDGAQLGGRTLTVNNAKPKEERSHGGPGGHRGPRRGRF